MGQRPNELTPEKSPLHRWGYELRKMRMKRGLSLRDLARKAFIDHSHLGRFERAERTANRAQVRRLDGALNAGGILMQLWEQRPWSEETNETEPEPDIRINAAPRTQTGMDYAAAPFCVLTWGKLEWNAPVEAVRATARDLAAAAAYADLLALGMDRSALTVLLQQLLLSFLGDRTPTRGGMLGHETTFGVMPVESSSRKAGVVMLKRGNHTGTLSPNGARKLAEQWLTATSATE